MCTKNFNNDRLSRSFEKIMEGNKAWAKEVQTDKTGLFQELSKGQHPDLLWIGCSDSRVPANQITGTRPGDVFVHRNVANLCVHSDMNMLSVLDFAVNVLKVKHIIVCGHYACGGVKAAMQPVDLGILNPWLRNIRDVYRLHKDELDLISDVEKKYDRLVELNVQEQCVNLIKTAAVQKAIRNRGLTVHGWVFDVHTGKIIDLKIDFDKILNNIMEIYHLD